MAAVVDGVARVAPATLPAARRRALAVTLLVLTVGLQAAGVEFSTLYCLPTTRLPELLIEALAAALVRAGLRRPVRVVVASVPVAALCLGAIIVWMHHDTWTDPWSYRGGFAVIALLATVLILHAELRPRSAMARIVAFAPLTLIGRRSYAAYLWYIPALSIAHNCATDPLEVFGITAGLTAVAATISWYAVELPFLERERQFERVHLHGGEAPRRQRERRPAGGPHRIRHVLGGRRSAEKRESGLAQADYQHEASARRSKSPFARLLRWLAR